MGGAEGISNHCTTEGKKHRANIALESFGRRGINLLIKRKHLLIILLGKLNLGIGVCTSFENEPGKYLMNTK
jgi:hypothetical protein